MVQQFGGADPDNFPPQNTPALSITGPVSDPSIALPGGRELFLHVGKPNFYPAADGMISVNSSPGQGDWLFYGSGGKWHPIPGWQDTLGASLDTDAPAPANTLTPTNGVHPTIGTGLIKTIVVPDWLPVGGRISFIPGGAFTTDATGNIGKGSTAVPGVLLIFVWDGTKFWPSY